MIKHIFSFFVLGVVLYLLITIHLQPEDFCYLEGENEKKEYSFVNQLGQKSKGNCANSIDQIGIKNKNPFIYYLVKYEVFIGLFLLLCAGIIFYFKKRKNLYKTKGNKEASGDIMNASSRK